MPTLSTDSTQAARANHSGSLAELRLLADESAVFYKDAFDAAGTGTVLGALFARLAQSKRGVARRLAKSAPAATRSAAGASAVVEIRQIRNELRARVGAGGEAYAESMKNVERRQLEAVLEVLDRDLPIPVKNAARPYLCASFEHQDLIDRALAHRSVTAAR